MAERRAPRVLGATRTLAEALTSSLAVRAEQTQNLISKIAAPGRAGVFSLRQLQQAIRFYSNHNSSYTNVLEDDFHNLVDEVLNNSIRSVLIYDDFSGAFSDAELGSLSMAFQYNLSVEAVTLNGVNVTDESVSMLCESLLRSCVNYIDLSNTPIEDEGGRSLAALAHLNPYLRTVILDDTLIPDNVLDEIDVACQFNQSNFDASGGSVDESLMKEADLSARKRRAQAIVRARKNNAHYCVADLFGCCPNGELCLYSHALKADAEEPLVCDRLSDKIAALFAAGGNWEEKLPPRPQEGASWRSAEDELECRPRLNLRRRREEMLRASAEVTASRDEQALPNSTQHHPPQRRLHKFVSWIATKGNVLTIALCGATVLYAFSAKRKLIT